MATVMLGRLDFALFKKAFFVFIVALSTAVAIKLLTDSLLAKKQQILAEKKTLVADSEQKLRQRQQAIALYQKLQAQLGTLSAIVFDPPDKLKWLEQIPRQADYLQLPSLTYQIKARKKDNLYNQNTPAGEFSVYSTRIEFQAGLVYDTQLVDFFAQLNQSGLGVFSPERCEIALANNDNLAFKPGQANLTANCVIEWYVIDKNQLQNTVPGFLPGAPL